MIFTKPYKTRILLSKIVALDAVVTVVAVEVFIYNDAKGLLICNTVTHVLSILYYGTFLQNDKSYISTAKKDNNNVCNTVLLKTGVTVLQTYLKKIERYFITYLMILLLLSRQLLGMITYTFFDACQVHSSTRSY